MAVYDISGDNINLIYDDDGDALAQAYDTDGNIVYTAEPPTLKVMTYNVQYFSKINSQSAMQSEIIQKYAPDIIGLQEIGGGTMPSVGVNVLNGYQYQVLGIQTNKTALASKIALEDATSAIFANQGSETRGYNKAYIDFLGKRICWLNAHLEVSNATPRYAQMAELFAMAEQEQYCILTGDFNQYSNSTASSDWQNMYKQFVDAGYHLANCEDNDHFVWTYSSKSTATGLDDTTAFYAPNCPDNIIASSNINIINVSFDDTKLSYLNGQTIDHIPIIAELQISQ